VFDGHLPLNPAGPCDLTIGGRGLRAAALAHYRESKQQSNKRTIRGLTQRSFEE